MPKIEHEYSHKGLRAEARLNALADEVRLLVKKHIQDNYTYFDEIPFLIATLEEYQDAREELERIISDIRNHVVKEETTK